MNIKSVYILRFTNIPLLYIDSAREAILKKLCKIGFTLGSYRDHEFLYLNFYPTADWAKIIAGSMFESVEIHIGQRGGMSYDASNNDALQAFFSVAEKLAEAHQTRTYDYKGVTISICGCEYSTNFDKLMAEVAKFAEEKIAEGK